MDDEAPIETLLAMNKTVSKANNTATYYLPNCQTLRDQAGMTKAALANAAGVSRDTISTIEKNHPVTAAKVHSVYNALAEKHKGIGPREVEITTALPAKSVVGDK